jgi:hypothetical protein
MNGLHHVVDHRVQDPPRFLDVAIGEQLHRGLEIREQHGNELALAFERSFGREDLFGEVLGSVGLRRAEPSYRDRCRRGD